MLAPHFFNSPLLVCPLTIYHCSSDPSSFISRLVAFTLAPLLAFPDFTRFTYHLVAPIAQYEMKMKSKLLPHYLDPYLFEHSENFAMRESKYVPSYSHITARNDHTSTIQ
ncbi:hypothetical protein BDB00DRAFT_930582 [Zychaea mexicana]|uniref:uncharacterized protein n=1 Tax=Zychaea mexicana TaxID=64656 RepID=UPI0022FEB8FE|nr:uncharacterized protein BDB00DRAFT_930582 [Zychaea mexicana]KAI9491281.1 hypothetical protein BDB00DRAFT_930582 [Zychaea mexicana]